MVDTRQIPLYNYVINNCKGGKGVKDFPAFHPVSASASADTETIYVFAKAAQK